MGCQYYNTGNSIAVFGLKHGSSGIAQIIADRDDIPMYKAKEQFKVINRKNQYSDKGKVEIDFTNKVKEFPNLPIFILIRDPEKAASASWIEDICNYLHFNSFKCILEIPEAYDFAKKFNLPEYSHTDGTPNIVSLDLKQNHNLLDEKELTRLMQVTAERVKPYYNGHFGSYHLDSVIYLLQLLTHGDLKVNSQNIFILNLDDYDKKANNLLVSYSVFHKDSAKTKVESVPKGAAKNVHYLNAHTTTSLSKKVKPLLTKLKKEDYWFNHRITSEKLSFKYIKDNYKQLMYTPNRFKNFLQEHGEEL